MEKKKAVKSNRVAEIKKSIVGESRPSNTKRIEDSQKDKKTSDTNFSFSPKGGGSRPPKEKK